MPQGEPDSSRDPAKGETGTAAAPILLLGAGGGIALGLARRFVADGRRVILSFRSEPKEAVELQLAHPEAVLGAFPLDARSHAAMERFFERVRGVTDRLSALVNAIGPFMQKSLGETPSSELEDLIQANLLQAFSAARLAHPLILANGGGGIIHFTFAGAEKLAAYREIAAYAVAKTALLSLTRSLAVEWAPQRIRVNAVAPGIVETENDDLRKYIKDIPQGRLTRVDDIYASVRYLLSPEAAHVTGVNLTVSGGYGWE